MDLGFGENGRAETGAEAEELKPETLKSHGENAFELVQWINLEKIGRRDARPAPDRDERRWRPVPSASMVRRCAVRLSVER